MCALTPVEMKRLHKGFQFFVAAICLTLVASALAFAQGARGTIRGKVTDPNGAVVPGASAKLIDVARNQDIRTVQTDSSGVYQFLEVDPATYTIVITAAGFAETRLAEVKVEPNRNLELDVALTIGAATADVTVTTAQELLDRDTPTLGTTVEVQRVLGLPLNGRNILDLALGQPGVTTGGGGLGIRANGARSVENNVQLDGSNNNEIAVGSVTGVTPRPDAVQEFRLLTSNFEAEFGRNSGTVINLVTKSGTNQFHGNVRAFDRPTNLSAARYFDQNLPTSKPRAGTTNDFRRRFERKEFGGNIGGPISLPHFGEGGRSVISGKNHAFFFTDFEARRQLIGDTRTISNLPTAEELSGIFTRPTTDPIIDPVTNAPFPTISSTGTTIKQQIPSTRFSPIATYYLGFLPVGNASGQATVGANEVTNFNIFTMRVDPLVTNKHTVGFTYSFFTQTVLAPFAFGGASVPGFPSVDPRRTNNIVLRHTFTISPKLVNSFLAGYARNTQAAAAPVNKTTPAQIGFTANFVADPANVGPPQIRLFDRSILIGNSIQGPQARVTQNFQLQDSLSYAVGNHRFKFGFDGTSYHADTNFLFINQGIITFTRQVGGNTTNDDLADLLLGIPTVIQFGSNGDRDFRQLGMAAFGQDTWHLSDTLSLSLGLRWEYVGPLSDKFNRVAYYRPSAAARGITSTLLTGGALKTFEGVTIPVGTGLRAPAGLLYVGDPDPDLGGLVTPGGVNKDLNNFAPRFGFAYSPKVSGGGMLHKLLGNQQTVFRGGFGVFYGAVLGDTALQQLTAPGYNGTNAFFSDMGGTLANPFAPDPFPLRNGIQPTIPNPFLTASAPFVGVSPVTRSLAGTTVRISNTSRAIDPFIRTPYTYQYNFTVERSFLRNYVASLSYVGNRGRKLYAIEQVNVAFGTLLPYPAGTPAAVQFAPTTAGGNINARRVNTDFGLGLGMQVAAGNSWYNSLQANLSRRFANGLLFQVAYTFSKSITDTAGTDTNRGNLDLLNRKFGKGLSSDDVPHRLVGSAVYDLPFAKNFKGVAKTVLHGFSIGGIATFESGRPFSVGNPFDTIAAGGGVISFADLGAAFQQVDPRQNQERAINVDSFKSFSCPTATFATCARRGTSGVNQFRARNGVDNFDFIVSKKTKLWSESSNLELRFEAFNAFNHTQFTTLNTNLTGIVLIPGTTTPDPLKSSFGKFTAARESRVIQIGARVTF
jgi:hypothetical protein